MITKAKFRRALALRIWRRANVRDLSFGAKSMESETQKFAIKQVFKSQITTAKKITKLTFRRASALRQNEGLTLTFVIREFNINDATAATTPLNLHT